ncbi:MAG TPA: hypothetical protein V6C58_04905 [Allocoleopsis sp.]
MQKFTKHQASEAKETLKQLVQQRPEIQAVGLTLNSSGYNVKVHLSCPLPDDQQIPSTILNVPVQTEIIGQVYVV